MIHPAFKKAYVEKNFPGANIDQLVRKILHEMDGEAVATASAPDNSASVTPSKSARETSSTAQFFEGDLEQEEEDAMTGFSEELLNSYFQEKDKKLSLLQQPRFSKIKKNFIKTNTQLLSSASSERVFSLAKHILTAPRTSLDDENFEKLVILYAAK